MNLSNTNPFRQDLQTSQTNSTSTNQNSNTNNNNIELSNIAKKGIKQGINFASRTKHSITKNAMAKLRINGNNSEDNSGLLDSNSTT